MTPNQCVAINADLCIACNSCVDVCRSDVMLPNNEKGMPPYVMYPDECWFCGCCVEHCPVQGAITMVYPINQRDYQMIHEPGYSGANANYAENSRARDDFKAATDAEAPPKKRCHYDNVSGRVVCPMR